MGTATKNVRVVAALGILLVACALISIVSAKAAEAAFPGENGQIAFQSNRDGNNNIHTIDPTGGTATNLTRSDGNSDPAFSPDGSRIAFVSGGALGYDIFVMKPDGSGRSQLTNTGSADSEPTWSSDGKKIAFVSNTFDLDGQTDSEIWVMNADGSDQHPITSNSFPDTRPAWSPLGDKIAFVSARTGDTNRNVYIMNSDGSGQNSITPNSPTGCSSNCYQGHDDDPAWSPDGSKIAYVHGYGPPTNPFAGGGVPNIWTMDPNGDNHTNVSNNPDTSASRPAWSPDGSKIAYVHVAKDSTDRNIAVMNADGSGQEAPPIDTHTAHDIKPDWGVAPDVTAPKVSTTTPTSGQTGVSRSIPGLTATFSEEMNPDTLTTSTVKLSVYNKKKKKWVPVTNKTVDCDSPCKTVTLDPYGTSSTLLGANKKYKVTITTGVKDKANNALAQNKVWTFTTGSS